MIVNVRQKDIDNGIGGDDNKCALALAVKRAFNKGVDTTDVAVYYDNDIEEDEEKLFFPLNKRVERHYYYAINDEALDSDGTLIQNIKRKMREINNLGQRATYAVYPTKYSNNFVYIITFSQNIQKDA